MYMPYMPYFRIERSKVITAVALSLIIFHQAVPQVNLPNSSSSRDNDEPLMARLSKDFQAFSMQRPQIAKSEDPDSLEDKEKRTTKIQSNADAQIAQVQQLALEAERSLANDERAQSLDKIVQPITTVTEFVGGQQEKNRGSGFVVGNYFMTVHHNLTTSFPSLRLKSTSYIDGMSVTAPIYANEKADVAVFELPDKLCVKHCNATEVAYTPDLSSGRSVYWLRKFEDDFILKEASIIKQVVFGNSEKTTLSCSDNAVMLVDAPFVPGSSGSPIMDSETGKIIGIIQGSVGEDEDAKGYFKPINCVIAMMNEPSKVKSIAKL